MDHLFTNQINNGCQLAVPDGLKELMSDISREVLRFRPDNVYSFIADFLAALLVTREHLIIASHVCACVAEKDISEALIDVGFDNKDVAAAIKIINENFDQPKIEEKSIMIKLAKSVQISEPQLENLQDIIRLACLKHRKIKDDIIGKLTSISSEDEIESAVNHTLDLYKRTKPPEGEYNEMAKRIKLAYKVNGIKRDVGDKRATSNYLLKEQDSETNDSNSIHTKEEFSYEGGSSDSSALASNHTSAFENRLCSFSYEDFSQFVASVEKYISNPNAMEKTNSEDREPKRRLTVNDNYYADDDEYCDLDYY